MLTRLALQRPELRAWAMYDWANSAMFAVIVTAIYPIFFARVAYVETGGLSANEVHARATAISLGIIALIAPLLGVVADRSASKKRLLFFFAAIGATACSAMFFIGPGEWRFASTLFVIANIGATGSFVFYDSLLPHVASREEMDQLSTSAFAMGYLGGGLLLALNLAWIQKPEWFGLPHGEGLTPSEATLPTRLSFLSVGLWWILFSIPLLRRVPEPLVTGTQRAASFGRAFIGAFTGLRGTLRDLLRYKQAALLLLAFLLYNDGISTVIRMATSYGDELGLNSGQMMSAILMVQFVGIPCTLLFGWIAGRVGSKRSIVIGLIVYTCVCVLARNLETAAEFFAMAGLIALVQGGTQALSRSLFASMIPVNKSGEFFGFFAVFDRFAGILGPLLFFQVQVWTGNVRDAVLPIIAMIVLGGVILLFVNVEEGRRAAIGSPE
ncbi:MAG: UMF1 family MFS transporter [Planctomycetota bacterium]|jgi:UMF1 family MFS transporter